MTFTSIPAAANAVDFAIAIDLGAITYNCPAEVVALVSDDKHFRTILARTRDSALCSNIYQVSDIEEAINHYKMLESKSLQDLHKYLTRSYGQENGGEFYMKLDVLFAQKHQPKNPQSCSNEAGSKKTKTSDQVIEKMKARLLSVANDI